MNELFNRQSKILRGQVDAYRTGEISLNSLIQRVEGISDVVGIASWKDALFPIIVNMEQLNSQIIDEKRGLTKYELDLIDKWLLELEKAIVKFEME